MVCVNIPQLKKTTTKKSETGSIAVLCVVNKAEQRAWFSEEKPRDHIQCKQSEKL